MPTLEWIGKDTPSVKMRKINVGELVYRTKAANQV